MGGSSGCERACACMQVVLPVGVAAYCGWMWYTRVHRLRQKSRREKEKEHLVRSGSQPRDVRDLNV